MVTGDDSAVDEDDTNTNVSQIIGWTFHKCLSADSSQNGFDSIRLRMAKNPKYREYSPKNDCKMSEKEIDEFLDSHFLGFSYIVPDSASAMEEQQFFSTLFRNLNYLGRKLSPLESRKSLYFLNDSFLHYFEGVMEDGSDVFSGIRIIENMAPRKIDVVRYLSILSQYYISRNEKKVMVGYSSFSSRESFYVDYVSYLLNLEQESRINKFDGFDFTATLGDGKWEERFKILAKTIEESKERMGLDPKHNAFQSWIDADYWLFGMIYRIVFEGKLLVVSEEYVAKINRAIGRRKRDAYYSKNPNGISNLRARLKESIEIWK